MQLNDEDKRLVALVIARYTKKGTSDECWLWTGKYGGKYPRIWLSKKKGYSIDKNIYIHRLLFYLRYGYWTPEIDHKCRHTWCVNEAHHRKTTHIENMQNRDARKRCNAGHLYEKVGFTMMRFPNGRSGRICNECRRS